MMQEFVQQMEDTVRESMYGIHTALPGTISAFDPSTGMATVKPEGSVAMKNGKRLKYPSIVKVPVVFPQAGGQDIVIAYPVKPGDGCVLIICENDLKPWMSHGKETESDMKFDLTNAVCIPGLFSEGTEAVQKAVDENAVIVRNRTMELMLKEDEFRVEHEQNAVQMDAEGIGLKCGEKSLTVRQSRIEIKGDLWVSGSIMEGG
ncbi:MAG: hypothetical protein K1W20_03450 [Lachnospiraceae bacterium]